VTPNVCYVEETNGIVMNPKIIENNTLQFPMYLVEGDNGQVGVSLYNFILSLAPETQTPWAEYYNFKDGEVTIEGERCLRALASSLAISSYNRIELFTPTHNTETMNCYFLYNDGKVELYED
jgi:hypothetical protein